MKLGSPRYLEGDAVDPPSAACSDRSGDVRYGGIIGLALAGFVIASYLALYQWRVIASVWEPVFDDSTAVVLTSVRRIPEEAGHISLPVSAILAANYALIVVLGVVARRSRSATAHVIGVFFSLAVVTSAMANLTLLLSQPTVFFAWCTLCLLSTVIAIAILVLAIPHLNATVQFLAQQRPRGGWRADE